MLPTKSLLFQVRQENKLIKNNSAPFYVCFFVKNKKAKYVSHKHEEDTRTA